ncbi:hypothetical protein EVAR_73949_1 [Eumeta japonica]|uniref:Uncharacterized protein n=1 Tax=Eumeta variegata TaxID=151549 RepID=A0A4C1SRM4_EUMVA|nr:hypothetical protein EVAR_73949_1 [Eumeta japonica]
MDVVLSSGGSNASGDSIELVRKPVKLCGEKDIEFIAYVKKNWAKEFKDTTQQSSQDNVLKLEKFYALVYRVIE